MNLAPETTVMKKAYLGYLLTAAGRAFLANRLDSILYSSSSSSIVEVEKTRKQCNVSTRWSLLCTTIHLRTIALFVFISYLLCFPIKRIKKNPLTLPKEPCPKTLRRSNWSDEAFSQPSLVMSLTSNSETTGSIGSCKEGFVSRFSRFDLEGVELITDSWLPSSSVVVSSLELALRSCYEICK